MAHAIGSKVWSKGDEYTITSLPFVVHGIELQSAVREDGKKADLPTPEYIAARNAKNQSDWSSQQVQFARLHHSSLVANDLRNNGQI